MSELNLKILFVSGIVAWSIIRYPYEKRNRQNKIVDERKLKLQPLLLLFALMGMLMLPIVDTFTSWLSFADYKLPIWANCVGILLYFVATGLYWKTHRDLGRNWSPTLQLREGHTLITTGIYKNIRHPMYTSIWLWCLAQPLLLQNYIAGLAGLITFGIIYFLRVSKEEKMMLDRFGDKYFNYMKHTGRILPKLFAKKVLQKDCV
ncbi:MAG: isoprenylcysteine carboxylmethyltransferase family protein [Hydrococcus sp. CRU_1_1]|nr:isoprenylcysteine carboxylmethyltransferase family protein [Hydrococcus sp. CRU_1_1]